MVKLSDEALKKRREYQRAWRKKNPDKDRAIRNRYWEKKAAQAAVEKGADNEAE